MEKFAVISLPDGGERITNNHPVLRHLPQRYAQLCLKLIPAQVTGVIMDREQNTELGYMLDVPGFFMDWDKLAEGDRAKHLSGIVRRLKDLGVYLLCFPLLHQYLMVKEIHYLQEQGIILLDGFYHRAAGLLLVLKRLLHMVRKELPYYETAVWGADTEVGRIWVEALAEQVNQMCIGGKNIKTLNFLADRILKSTGLSCQITTQMENCLNHKHITVLAEPIEGTYTPSRPSIQFVAYHEAMVRQEPMEAQPGIYTAEMGWMGFPDDLAIGHPLQPWEELGVLEGLFYTISRVYRDDILERRISLKQLERLHALYGLYPLKVNGFIQNNVRFHFDRFRAEYFQSGNGERLPGNNIP